MRIEQRSEKEFIVSFSIPPSGGSFGSKGQANLHAGQPFSVNGKILTIKTAELMQDGALTYLVTVE